MNTNEGYAPIFIVGTPRSGTTLLRVLLNRHPELAICDESHYFYYVYTRRKAFGNLSDPKNRKLLIDRYLAIYRIRRLGFDHNNLASYLMQYGDSYPNFFKALLEYYASQLKKSRCGEKTPHHALFIDVLLEWFPECRLIHLVRDPRGVVASLMRMPWGSKSIATNARSWVHYVRTAERASHNPNFLRIYYEDLILKPDETLGQICEFTNLPYLSGHWMSTRQSDLLETSSEWWFQRARGPLDKERIGNWREELTPEQIARTEFFTGDVMKELGYTPICSRLVYNDQISAYIDEAISYLGQRFGNLGRLWYYWIWPTQLAKEEAFLDRHRRV
jgi:hypothetical protein